MEPIKKLKPINNEELSEISPLNRFLLAEFQRDVERIYLQRLEEPSKPSFD